MCTIVLFMLFSKACNQADSAAVFLLFCFVCLFFVGGGGALAMIKRMVAHRLFWVRVPTFQDGQKFHDFSRFSFTFQVEWQP